MNKKISIPLEVNPILVVDDDTAQLMLWLIEMYCAEKDVRIREYQEGGKRKLMFTK